MIPVEKDASFTLGHIPLERTYISTRIHGADDGACLLILFYEFVDERHEPREGGFEVLLSEDGTQAKGIWWYSRVGTQKNIPPREHGGTFVWKRVTPPPATR